MAKKTDTKVSSSVRTIRPALTPEAERQQNIALANNLVRERLLNGTATSQETVFFLKLGAEQEERDLKLEQLREENRLLRAKTEALEEAKNSAETYANAINAMMTYGGRQSHDGEADE